MPIKGMSLATYEPRGFYNAQAALDRLLYDHCNWIALNVFLYQDTTNSVTIDQHPLKTADDQSIREITARAHARGLRVFLKVNVDSLDEGWRGGFNPTDQAAWFASYGSNLVHYAQLAAETGAELFSVGTEFVSLAQTNNLARWQGLISQVRAVYSGPLIYCANWDEASVVPFWPRLDYIGIDAYYPLHRSNTVTAAQIAAAWTNSQSANVSFTGRNWYAEIDALRRSQNKNVIFTEIGYSSADGGAEEPWRYDLTTCNLDLQRACHEGSFVFWNGVPWFEGMFVWKWNPKMVPTGINDTDSFVYGKPAETALREQFAGGAITLLPWVATPLQPCLASISNPHPVLSWYALKPPRYEFFGWEDFDAMGWYSDDYSRNQGFGGKPLPQVVTSAGRNGTRALKCHLKLVAGDAAYNQGLLWVDLSQPVNLNNRVVSVALWIPSTLINGSRPNGVQLVFKDVNWNYCDTTWANITAGNQWTTFSAMLPRDINWNAGIDLSQVAHIGFKIGAGSGSGTSFDGDIYVDDYDLRAGPTTLYRLQLSRDAAFSAPEVDAAGLSAIYFQPPSALSPGIRYWRVQMDQGAGYGPWSEITLSALSPVSFVGADSTSQGNWPGVYGQIGYLIPGSANTLPADCLGSVTGAGYFATLVSADAPEALELGPVLAPLPRSRGCWYSTGTALAVDFNLPAGVTNRLALYCAGPDGRAQMVELLDPVSGAVLDTRNLSNFASGTYLSWDVRSPVQARITSSVPGKNAVLQGIFLGSASGTMPSFRAQPVSSTVVNAGSRVALAGSVSGAPPLTFQWVKDNQPVAGATGPVLVIPSALGTNAGRYWLLASNALGYAVSQAAELVVVVPDPTKGRLLAADSATRGNWKGTYGSGTNGYLLLGQATNLASGSAVTFSGGSYFTLSSSTTSPSALERVGNTLPTDRFLGCYFSATNFTVNVSLPTGVTNTLALYLVLADGWSERVDLINPANGTVIESQTVTGSSNGLYLVWAVNGPVLGKVTRLAGANAMLSAVFIGSGTGAPVVRTQPPASVMVGGGGAAAFGVSASGLPALTYQWWKNGVPVAEGANLRGPTAPVLQLSQVGAAEAGDYSLVVTNVYGRATSTVCRVSVCISVLSEASAAFGASGGTGSFTVTNGFACGWAATPNQDWLHTGSSGNGNGTVSYTVGLNPEGTARSGLLTISGLPLTAWQTYTVFQAGTDTWTIYWQHTNGTLAAYYMDGTNLALNGGVLLTPSQIDPTWQLMAAADLNRDGRPELLWQHQAGALGLWYLNGTALASATALTPAKMGPEWKIVATPDLSGDGQAEVLWQSDVGWLGVWFMDGATMTNASYLTPNKVDPNWRMAGTLDLNGDGRPEILWRHKDGGLGAWFLNGLVATNFVMLTPAQAAASWKIVGAGNRKPDGKPMILWQSDSGEIGVWYLNGTTMESFSWLNPSKVAPAWRIKGMIQP